MIYILYISWLIIVKAGNPFHSELIERASDFFFLSVLGYKVTAPGTPSSSDFGAVLQVVRIPKRAVGDADNFPLCLIGYDVIDRFFLLLTDEVSPDSFKGFTIEVFGNISFLLQFFVIVSFDIKYTIRRGDTPGVADV